MPRSTPTHQAALACADKLWAARLWPTPTRVRNELGSGSYSTICKALAAWRQKRGLDKAPADVVEPDIPLGSSGRGLPEASVQSVQELSEELARALLRLMPTMGAGHRSAPDAAQVAKDAAEALQLMQGRLDAVQKHMLMSIEQARADAAHWKQRAQELKDELGTWRVMYQQRHDADQREIRLLHETVERLKATKA